LGNNYLREYLLKGYAINQRVDRIDNNLENLSKEVSKISIQLKTNELPTKAFFSTDKSSMHMS